MVHPHLRYGRYKRESTISERIISRYESVKERAFCDLFFSDKVKDQTVIHSVRNLYTNGVGSATTMNSCNICFNSRTSYHVLWLEKITKVVYMNPHGISDDANNKKLTRSKQESCGHPQGDATDKQQLYPGCRLK